MFDINNTVNLSKNIDLNNRIEKVTAGCKVTIYFKNIDNKESEKIVLESLLDTFEKRINTQIYNGNIVS